MRPPTVAAAMARKAFLLLSLLIAAALAGCSKGPPAGALAAGDPALTVDGTSDLHFQAFSSGGNPTGVIPTAGNTTQCAQDQLPMQPPGMSKCTPAMSTVHVHFMALPQPEAAGYKVVLTGGTTAEKEREVGELAPGEGAMWDLNKTYSEDLAKHFTTIVVKAGDFVVAQSPASQSGKEAFAVPKDYGAITAKGTYKGKALSVDVSGLPGNGTFMGRLYTQDPKTCITSMAESFPVKNGANTFTAKVNIASYAQFHIHVGASLINLYKADIHDKAPACKPTA